MRTLKSLTSQIDGLEYFTTLYFKVGFMNPRDTGLLFSKHPSDVAQMWQEAEKLSNHYGRFSESPLGFVPDKLERPECAVTGLIKLMGQVPVDHKGYRSDLIKRDISRFTDEYIEKNPGTSRSRASYEVICHFMYVFRYLHIPSSLEDFPDGPNPLYDTIREMSAHGEESRFKPDNISRALPWMWSAMNAPNCLGNATQMLSFFKALGLRFYLASGLRLESTATREIQIETSERALKLMRERNIDPERAETLQGMLKEKRKEDLFDWMYHHFVIVQCDKVNDDWAIIDPYLGANAFIPNAREFTKFADALDARKEQFPGLAVAIDFHPGLLKKLRKQLRGKLTRCERHFRNLVAAFQKVPKSHREQMTIKEFQARLARSKDPRAERSFKWLINKLRRSKYEDPNVKLLIAAGPGSADNAKAGDSPEAESVSLETQFEYVEKHLNTPAVPWLITRAINVGMIDASRYAEKAIEERSHLSFEVYADPYFALGILISNAAAASTGLRTLSPELLRLTTSQLVWQEVAEPDHCQCSHVVSLARRVADLFIGGLPENRTHPLVSRRRRLLKIVP